MKQKSNFKKPIKATLALAMAFSSLTPVSLYAYSAQTPNYNCSDDENAYAIYPIPQAITYNENHTSFTLSNEVALVIEEGVDSYTSDYVKEVLADYKVAYQEFDTKQDGKTNILIGIDGSKGYVDTYADQITLKNNNLYEQNDAYMLDANQGTMVIEGKDSDATFYGVATLKMMFSSFNADKFLDAHIEDYASVKTRGYIEGFYGAWTHEQRKDLMLFARDYKFNSYVYAAKGDAYHTSQWNQLYPNDKINEFKELVELGKKTKVEFGWSIHMGSFFSGLTLNSDLYNQRYDALIKKLDQLYNIGVRKFDFLNDDFGSGSHDVVVTVLNRINKEYIQAKGCEPMSYCPQGYNTSWSGNGAELVSLQKLDDSINIYWTGYDVNTPIDQTSINYLYEKSQHKADYWLNYPVNEHCGSGIFLGDITYYARDNVTGMEAFHSNPCRYPYASEVALYQLAAYTWNNTNYSDNAIDIWESAFNYLQPEVKDAYFKIASNLSNASGSSRVPGYNESEYLKDTISKAEAALNNGTYQDSAEFKELRDEFKAIQDAITTFRKDCTNKGLINDLDPWLNALMDVATAGENAMNGLLALANNDISTAWTSFSVATTKFSSAYTYQNAVTTCKAGSKYLYPFVNKALTKLNETITPMIDPTNVQPKFIAVMGGNEVTINADVMKAYDGNPSTYATWQVNQKAGDYFGFDLGKVTAIKDITILQGQNETHHDIFHDATLQYSVDGKEWHEIEAVVDGNSVTVENANVEGRYVRYYLNATGFGTKPNFWTYVREFSINETANKQEGKVYTNIDALKTTPLTYSGVTCGLYDLGEIELGSGEYIGIDLGSIQNVGNIVGPNVDDLLICFSTNGQIENVYSEGLAGFARYVYLSNNTQNSIKVNLNELSVNLVNFDASLSFVESNLTNGLANGSYDNIFDGDLATSFTSANKLFKGEYLVYDLGNFITLNDIELVMSDGNEHLYQADIQISNDLVNWETVGKVDNDDKFIVPYRYVNIYPNGKVGRYLRIYVTENSDYALKLHEIRINQNVNNSAYSPIVTEISGNKANALDKDLMSTWNFKAKANDSFDFEVSQNAKVKQLSMVFGSEVEVKVEAYNSGKVLYSETLKGSASIIDLPENNGYDYIKVTFLKDGDVAIHELAYIYGADLSGDLGQYVENIVEDGVVMPEYRDLAPNASVEVSGTSDGDKNNVNDGDENTKWDSNFIKDANGDIGDAWIYLDLKANYDVDKVVASFFNKIYPTSWRIEGSNDANEWNVIVDDLTMENNGATHPVKTITFDAVNYRYIRLYFNTLNTAAAGNGVGVKEINIFGKEHVEVADKVVDTTSLASVIALYKDVDGSQYTKETYDAFKTALDAAIKAMESELTSEQALALKNDLVTKANALVLVKDVLDETTLINTEANKNQVSVIAKTSEADSDYATNVLDYNDQTMWHSDWGSTGQLPQSITFDLGKTYLVSDVTFKPRFDDGTGGSHNGDILKAKIYVSEDNNFTDDDLVGTFEWAHGSRGYDDRGFKRAQFDQEVTGRYVKFEAIETYGADTSNKYASMGEIRFYGIVDDSTPKPNPVVKTDLNKVIEEAEKVNKADYTDESVKALDEALSAAKALLANEKATQDEVDAAAKALTNAISALVKKPVVNKAELEKAIEEAEKVDTTNKTAESKAVLTSAITSAKEVLADEKATQANVDAAIKAINDAVANLKDIEVKPDPKPEYKGYDDVDSDAWYAGMVQEATIKGLMGKDGSSGNNFNPDGKITRGMVATVLYRMAGEPKVTYADKFSDVKDGLWYSNGIVWASEVKVVSGYANGKFGPDDAIKREDFAIMLRNYANTCGLNTKSSQSLETFKDYKAVSAYAKDAIAWCVENGLMSGSKKGEETYLNPSANTTRAEAAKMFVQLSNLIKK